MGLADIDKAIAAIGRGEIIIVVDDEDRENEGDLIIPAQFATPPESSPAGNVGPGAPMSNPAGETGPAPPKSAWRRPDLGESITPIRFKMCHGTGAVCP